MAEAGERVYTLMVEVGRVPGDGLPEDCDGAAILCFASGRSERHAVDETVAVLREAGMAPLEVESHGTIEEREAAGMPLSEEDRALAARALAENAVIVVQVVPFDDDAEEGAPPPAGPIAGRGPGRRQGERG